MGCLKVVGWPLKEFLAVILGVVLGMTLYLD
jgi:hypothetical protein